MWNIIIGIIFIFGGLSGQLVLRGTNSSGALVVVGVGLVIWGGVKMSKKVEPKRPDKNGEPTTTALQASLCPKCGNSIASTDQNCPSCHVNLAWARQNLTN